MASLVRLLAIAASAVIAAQPRSCSPSTSPARGATPRSAAVEDDGRRVGRAHAARTSTPPSPRPRSSASARQEHSSARECIDDGNDILATPFTGIAASDNVWVQRLVTAALGLLLFGFGGLMLANWLPAAQARAWRLARARELARSSAGYL